MTDLQILIIAVFGAYSIITSVRNHYLRRKEELAAFEKREAELKKKENLRNYQQVYRTPIELYIDGNSLEYDTRTLRTYDRSTKDS